MDLFFFLFSFFLYFTKLSVGHRSCNYEIHYKLPPCVAICDDNRRETERERERGGGGGEFKKIAGDVREFKKIAGDVINVVYVILSAAEHRGNPGGPPGRGFR